MIMTNMYQGMIGLDMLTPELREMLENLIEGGGTVGSSVIVSETEPGNMKNGQVWFELTGEEELPPRGDCETTIILANAVITDDEPEDKSGRTIWLDPLTEDEL